MAMSKDELDALYVELADRFVEMFHRCMPETLTHALLVEYWRKSASTDETALAALEEMKRLRSMQVHPDFWQNLGATAQ